MKHVNFLRVTSNNMFYGGRHDGTFTVDTEDAKHLRAILQQAKDDLADLAGTAPHDTAHDTINDLKYLIDHIDEYTEDTEDTDE